MSVSPAGAITVPFGKVIAPMMVSCRTSDGVFSSWSVNPVEPLPLHPASHVLHYGSACFEGLKAHRGQDGVVRLFRAADHVRRMRASAAAICLPIPPTDLLLEMIHTVVEANLVEVPPSPGALYIRPTLIGVDANIGAAGVPSIEALLLVIASPVGEYFDRTNALTVRVETRFPRTTPHFGTVKTGANYAMALGITMRARAEDGADQVLFAPGGDVQETGAANFMLLDDGRIVTKALDTSFLHGITRDSVLTIAPHLGYEVEERNISLDELLSWAERGEAALVGTAAVLSGVGVLVYNGERILVGDGAVGTNTARQRAALVAVQRAVAPDLWGWTHPVNLASRRERQRD